LVGADILSVGSFQTARDSCAKFAHVYWGVEAAGGTKRL
jgi:hypothetical protein